MPILIPYKTEAEWLKLRESDVTSSDIAALFNESPYTTEYELYHRKKDGLVVIFDENDRVKWGRRLESPIAHGIAEDRGWKITPLKVYMRHSDCPGFGSSFDFEIEENGQMGLLEIKNVDYAEYKSKWLVDGEEIESPIHIELQAQAQMEVADREFCYIAALISGNNPIVTRRERDREIGKLMRGKVTTFWRMIKDGIEPHPDFSRDMEVIKLLYADTSGGEVDLTTNNRFNILVSEYGQYQQAESAAKKAKETAKAEMITLMGTAGLVKYGSGCVTRKTVKRAGYSVEPCEYQDMRIKPTKGDKK